MKNTNQLTKYRLANIICAVGLSFLGIIGIILTCAFVAISSHFLTRLFPLVYTIACGVLLVKCIREIIRTDKELQSSVYEEPAVQEEEPPEIKPQPAKKETPIHPMLKAKVDILKGYVDHINQQMDSVEDYLDDFFGSSQISKSRYNKIMKDSRDVVEQNYRKALQAAKLFGTSSQPNETRLAIMDNYIADSQDVCQKVEVVINQLILVDQQDTLQSSDSIDLSLEELAQTTRLYGKGGSA